VYSYWYKYSKLHLVTLVVLVLFSGAVAEASSPASPVLWSRSLNDLGYATDIRASGLEGEVALDWPVPAGAEGGELRLALGALTTAGFTAVLDVFVNGRGMATRQLAPGESRLALTLPLPPEALTQGTLRVSLRYAAAAGGSRCRDKRLGGVALAVDPATTLALNMPAPRRAADALALLPATIRVALPEGPLSEAEYQTLLTTAAFLARTGHRISVISGGEADVVLSRNAAAPALRPEGGLVLPLREALGEEPARGAAPLSTNDTSLALPVEGAREAYTQAAWSFAIPELPAGRIPTALMVQLVHGADAPGIHHVVHLMINSALAASAELAPGRTDPVTLPIPAGLLGFAGRATLRFERIASTGCLEASAPLPVTLAPNPRLLLGPAPGHARQFFEIVHAADNGLSVYLPTEYLGDPGPSLPVLAALLKDYWTPGTPLDLHMGGPMQEAPTHPFILIARTAPAALSIPLREEAAAVLIETRDKRPVLTLARAEGGFATLARMGAQDGLWIAPPTLGEMPARIRLEHGNLAVFDATGIAFWLNTEAPRGLTLRYADATGLGDVFSKSWLFGMAALWCLATLATLIALARRGFKR